MRSTLLLCTFLLAQISPSPAQNAADPHRYDAQIEQFLEQQQADSFYHYSQEKCRLAQLADSLELWAWTQFDAHEAFELSDAKALELLDHAEQNRWRQPRSAAEWQPFLYISANRGWYLFLTGKIWQSVQAYEQAAQGYERYRYPDFDALEIVYKPLGAHYTRLGDNEKALAIFQKALILGGDNESLAGLYANIGIAYWNQADFSAAEIYYRQGLALEGVSAAQRGLLLGRLAETLLDGGKPNQAQKTAAQAVGLLLSDKSDESASRAYRALARRISGLANLQLGHTALASRILLDALADDLAVSGAYSREAGKDQIALARNFLAQNNPRAALDAANRALHAVIPGFSPALPADNPEVGQFLEENTIFEGLAVKADAAKMMGVQAADPQWLMLALRCHDLAWQAESRLRQVFQYSSSKLGLQKSARARESAAMEVARLLFEKTGETVWLEKAFAITERSKAALLLEALQDNLVRQRLSSADVRFEQLNGLRQNLSFFEKQLLLDPGNAAAAQWRDEKDALISQIATLLRALRQDHPSLSVLEQDANWLPTPGDLREGEALVSYFVGDQWVDALIFQYGKPAVWRRIANDSALQTLVRQFLAYFQSQNATLNDPAGYLQTAHALWQKIVPAEAGASPALTILPDGFLSFIPFEALVTNNSDNASLRNAAYLLRQQTVRYAWSLAVLRQQKASQSHAEHYLLSMSPGFAQGERGLAPLVSSSPAPGWFSGWGSTDLEGKDADLRHFLKESKSHRMLHLSTHAFAGDHPRIEFFDQPLLLPDLYAQPLQADLVVLSACQTGLGTEEKGEGVMSLARAFAQAGAACIVSSLWSVNDRSTAQLFQLFYQKIAAGKTSGEALREAKLAYLNDPKVGTAMQSPYFWAGIVAVGDDRAVAQPGMGWAVIVLAIFLLILGYCVWKSRGRFRKRLR